MDIDLYNKEQYDRVVKIYVKSKHSNFINKKGQADWYINQLKSMIVNVIIVKLQYMISQNL